MLMNNTQVVVFKVGESSYGIPVCETQEIIQLPQITRIPQGLKYLEGVINLRNCSIPVINLGTYFGVEKELGEQRVVIIKVDSQTMGLLVGEVEEVMELPPQAITTLMGFFQTEDEGMVSGVANLGDRLLILLDPYRLIKLKGTDEIPEMISQETSSFYESEGI